ncbi:glucokinase [Cesiribacter sp. SM1]|uniref:glucokinase n=1 Tax=Cesiribacter sp. SM1 TaxID=2861196 RepID=UPI001CD5FC8F|nr:glucokinase [Cesiribacter sp. SM1]
MSLKPFPIYLPNQQNWQHKNQLVIAADIGGTKTAIALYEVQDNSLHCLEERKYQSAQYSSFLDLLNEFITATRVPDKISIGIAGPVLHGKAEATNLPWVVSRNEIIQWFNIRDVFLLNDLEANAYGLAALQPDELATLYAGKNKAIGNAAVISAGTGLGEAGLYWDGSYYHPFPTEGGHTDFAPRSETDAALYRYLHKKWTHVSWERVLSGPGIYNIYSFLRDELKREEPAALAEAIKTGDAPRVISTAAKETQEPICVETMDLFVHYLGVEASNMVLKMKATGGLFLGGGIAPKIRSLLTEEKFQASYLNAGRMKKLVEETPVHIILNEKTALLGAAYYGAFSGEGNN